MSQQKKTKVGRPKLPKGEAKGRIEPVRFTAEDLKAMAAEAKAGGGLFKPSVPYSEESGSFCFVP